MISTVSKRWREHRSSYRPVGADQEAEIPF